VVIDHTDLVGSHFHLENVMDIKQVRLSERQLSVAFVFGEL
jgi:hypothetical protein